MKKGILIYDMREKRYVIKFEDSSLSDGLHCGEHMQVNFEDKWIDTRIELDGKRWYLVGIKLDDIEYAEVKIWNKDNKTIFNYFGFL